MKRIVKKHDQRKKEIVEIAQSLFNEVGYANTSVARIINKAEIAKGTFYHYFKSKEELLEAIVEKTTDKVLHQVRLVASDNNLSPIRKFEKLFSNGENDFVDTENIKNTLHEPENRELHEKTNIQLILKLSPIITQIVKEGIKKGTFDVEEPLEAIQFLLVASQFLFDEQLFPCNEEELRRRRCAMQNSIERTLGAPKNSFKFLLKR